MSDLKMIGVHRRIRRLPAKLALRYRGWRDPFWSDGWGTFEVGGERFLFKQAYDIDWWADQMRRRRYEPVALDHFSRKLSAGDVVLDVGAWIGIYSLLASRRVGAGGRVFAFEPNPTSRALLEANIERNEARNVTVIPAAVTDRPGEMWLRWRGLQGSPETMSVRKGGDLEVSAVTLASFCAARDIAPAVIKVDVEGAEAEVLTDGAAELVRQARATLVEIHDQKMRDHGVEPAHFLECLAGWGLEIRELESRSAHNHTISLQRLRADGPAATSDGR